MFKVIYSSFNDFRLKLVENNVQVLEFVFHYTHNLYGDHHFIVIITTKFYKKN